jgi:hypothetical protein
MASATAMYHSSKNPLKRVARDSEEVAIPKGLKVRRLHKAFLRYHDANNWPLLREALRRMGRADLIGPAKHQLVPAWQPAGTGELREGARARGDVRKHGGASARPFRTQHTGLPRDPAPRGGALPRQAGGPKTARPGERAAGRPASPRGPGGRKGPR